jgi:hypothetical protein
MPESTLKQGSLLLIAGLDTSKPGEYIDAQAASMVQNFSIDRALLSKRYGTAVRGAIIGGTDIELMAGREITIDGIKYNVRIGRDKIERYNGGTLTWLDITGTDLTGSTDDLIDTAVPLLAGKTILVIANGIDVLQKWPGTGDTAALGGTPPVAKFVQEYKTYLVCANIAGGVDVDQRVQWSDTASPEIWDSGNAGAVDLVEDGEAITGLNVFSDYVCVHKKTSIYLGYLVSSTSIFRFDRKSTEVGTVANGSIVNLPTGQQIFLGIDGLHLFNGITAPLIESPVNDEIRDGLNKSAAHKAWGILVQDEDEVWIGVPIGDQTHGETVYKYNYNTGVCYKDTRTNINTAWAASTSTALTWDDFEDSVTWDDISNRWDDGQLGAASADIHFGSTDGYTYTQSISANGDGSATIPCVWASKIFENQEKGRLCRWSEIQVYAKGSGTLIVEYSTDGGNTWVEAYGSPITLGTYFPDDDSPTVVYLDVISSRLQVRFRNDTATDVVEIKQFFVGYFDRELRR